jgi:hypothetical protein
MRGEFFCHNDEGNPKMDTKTKTSTAACTLTVEEQAAHRAMAHNRKGMGWCLSEAAYIRQTLARNEGAIDQEVEAGMRHTHDLLVLMAAATPAVDRTELSLKHEALAGVKPLDPLIGHLSTVVNAALAADWRRFEEQRKYGRDVSGLH